jgi:hypothetical protein
MIHQKLLLPAVAATALILAGSTPTATADPTEPWSALAPGCPDVEVVFARGTNEPPGIGETGQAFVDGLIARLGERTFAVYPVNYPASLDFATAVDGIADASSHIEATAASCPNTKVVLGGYSQGAAVAGFVTSNRVPDGIDPMEVPRPMPPEVAEHVATVVLMGKPSNELLIRFGAPSMSIGPLYAPKTLDLCAVGDPICSDGDDNGAHNSYVVTDMTGQAADFAAGLV